MNNSEVTMSNDKQSSVEWLVSQLKISTYWNNLISELELMECGEIDILEQAKAMHKEEIEASYSDGYKEGYNRAIELTKWTISNLIPPHND